MYDRPEHTSLWSGGRSRLVVFVIAILIALFMAEYFFV
jgi:hypothetical protein